MADIPCPYCETRPRPNPECGGCRGRGFVLSVDLTSTDDLGHVQYQELTRSRLVQLSCVIAGDTEVLEDPVAWLHRAGLVLYRCRAVRKGLVVRPIGSKPELGHDDAWRAIYHRTFVDVWLPWLTDRGWERVETYPTSQMLSPSGGLYNVFPGLSCPAVDVALARERIDLADELAIVERIRGRVVRRLILGRESEVSRG